MRMGLFLFVNLITMLTVGCGTISGSKQLVSFDSDPRGSLADLDGEGREPQVFRTPQTLEVKRSPNLSIGLLSTSDKRVFTHDVNCSLRWGESIVSDGLLGGLGLVSANPFLIGLGLSAYAIDYFTDNIYECPDLIKVPTPKGTTLNRELTPRIAILYSEHLSTVDKENLSMQWSRTASKIWPSFQIVDLNIVDKQSEALNLQSLNREDLVKLKFRHWQKFLFETQASYVVLLERSKTSEQPIFEAIVYDPLKRTFIHTPKTALTLDARSESQGIIAKQARWLSLRLLPNSIYYTTSYTHVRIAEAGSNGYEVDSVTTNRTIPTYLAKIGLTNVDHPRIYDPWDIAFSLYPTLMMNYVDKTIHLTASENYRRQNDNANQDAIDVRARVLSVNFLLSLGPDFHTPIGRIGLYYLMGPNWDYVRSSLGDNYSKWSYNSGYEVNYLAFVSTRVFINSYLRVLSSNTRSIETQFFADYTVQYHVGTSIGVYLK